WPLATTLTAPPPTPRQCTRHIADSLQLLDLAPGARVWADLGTGGGFPGLMIAIALADQPGTIVHLIDSNKKKSACLSEAQRVTGAPAAVHVARIEEFAAGFAAPLDVVTARAVAPLKLLLK